MRSYIEKNSKSSVKNASKIVTIPMKIKKESKNKKKPVKATNTRPKYIGTSPALLYCIETMIILLQTESKKKEKKTVKSIQNKTYIPYYQDSSLHHCIYNYAIEFYQK